MDNLIDKDIAVACIFAQEHGFIYMQYTFDADLPELRRKVIRRLGEPDMQLNTYMRWGRPGQQGGCEIRFVRMTDNYMSRGLMRSLCFFVGREDKIDLAEYKHEF